jgi:hypothetical protein
MFPLIDINMTLRPQILNSSKQRLPILSKWNNEPLINIGWLWLSINFDRNTYQLHKLNNIVFLYSIDAIVSINLSWKLIYVYILTVCYYSDIVLAWQARNYCRELLSYCWQLFLLDVYINYKQVGVSVIRCLRPRSKFECCVLCHKFIGKFIGANLLCVIGRKRGIITTNTTPYGFLIEIDFAERIKDSLTTTR